MGLARNTYRFALLLVGYGIASGIDDLGAYSAEGPALIGLGLGGVALLCGTLAGYAAGPDTGPGSDDNSGDSGPGVEERSGGDGTLTTDTDRGEGEGTGVEESDPARRERWDWRW